MGLLNWFLIFIQLLYAQINYYKEFESMPRFNFGNFYNGPRFSPVKKWIACSSSPLGPVIRPILIILTVHIVNLIESFNTVKIQVQYQFI